MCYPKLSKKNQTGARYRRLTHIILPTWEAEIERIEAEGQPEQIVQETPISKITRAKWTGGMAQIVEPALPV
jgi:hypothetical protein